MASSCYWDPIQLLNICSFDPPSSDSGCWLWPPELCFSSSSELASSSSALGIQLSSETVDSVMVAFNLGFHNGMFVFMPAVGGAVMILVLAYLLNYVVSRS